MKTCCKAFVITAVVSTLSIPVFAQSASDPASQTMQASALQSGANEAMKMVPANARLSRTLDADKDHPNSSIEASLSDKVTLSDGTVLPTNTTLIGKITSDDMHKAGMSKLVLSFNQARLKDGKVVPVKVTIIDILAPDLENNDNSLNGWTSQTLGVDQVGVISGVDLHSRIASNNSGVFVSTRKHDVKLQNGSELQLAIGPAANASTSAS